MNETTSRTSESRRAFLTGASAGIGTAALQQLLSAEESSSAVMHHVPKAKRVIYLFQSGGPSQADLFDPKPELDKYRDKPLPSSVRGERRITTMTSKQKQLLVAPTNYKFHKRGSSELELSELLPHLSRVADDLCLIRSMHTEAINHDPAITYFQTGFQLASRPSIGAWVSYGLGAINVNLPAYIVLTSNGGSGAQPLYNRLWGAGFLPNEHSGVKLRNSGAPVFYLSNPPGITSGLRRDMLNDLAQLNQKHNQVVNDPSILARIKNYEMAFRMQTSVPELADISSEPQHILDLYGPEVKKPGTYARNCLLARRLAERDVRFIQLFHMGWDHHGKLAQKLPKLCSSVDQPTTGLLLDLKRRGLLEDTLVVFCGEFGRTIYAQSKGKAAGRDHHGACFSAWVAGAGVKQGTVYGATDPFSYNVASDPVHVHDFNATLLHLLGIDHERLVYRFQGRQYRLTDVHGNVVDGILS